MLLYFISFEPFGFIYISETTKKSMFRKTTIFISVILLMGTLYNFGSVQAALGPPDLKITSITIDNTTIVYKATPWTWIHFTTENGGESDATSVRAQLANIFKDGSPITPSGYIDIGNVTASGSVTKSFAVGHDSGWPPGNYSLQVMVDYLDSVEESDETNNLSPTISFTVIEDGPNLVITDISIDKTIIEYQATPWTWIHFTAKNIGTQDAYFAKAQLANIIKDGSPITPSGYIDIGNVTAGGSVTKSFAVGHDSGWPPGNYSLQVMVDYLNEITETNENDNLSPTISFVVTNGTLTGPNLVISSISIDKTTIEYQATPWTWVHFTVNNTGTEDAYFIKAALHNVLRDGSAVTTSGYIDIGNVTAGGSVTKSFAVGHDSGWPPGNYSLQVYVDHQDDVSELDETDNVSPTVSFVVVQPKPNLIVSSITIDNATIVHQATPWTWIHITVNNTGSEDALDVRAHLVNVLKDGVAVEKTGFILLGDIMAGASATKSFAVGHDDGWPPGNYSLQVEVDKFNAIEEENESDNLSALIRFSVINPSSTTTDTSSPITSTSSTTTQTETSAEKNTTLTPTLELPTLTFYVMFSILLSFAIVYRKKINNIELYR